MKVKDSKEFGRHFCSEVHAVEVTAKLKEAKGEVQGDMMGTTYLTTYLPTNHKQMLE